MDTELEELARLSRLDERLSVMRHDLFNVLNGIRNAAFYLRRKSEKTPLWEEDRRFATFFDLIEDGVRRGEDTLSREATVETVLRRELTAQRLDVGVRRGLETLPLPDGVRLETDYAQAAPVPLWEVEIALLTRCLVENAVEAVEPRKPVVVRVRTRSDGDGHWLEVQDTGPGMSRDAVAAALQPFRSGKPEHLGIGLNIVRRIVQRYGGRMTFREPEGGGLCVAICFP